MKSKYDIEDIEIRLLLKGIYEVYGFDFQEYAESSLKRRIYHFIKKNNFSSCSDLQSKILYDKKIFDSFLYNMSITVTEMFRDPSFYRSFSKFIIPKLRSYPFFKIWHAGCATGEEVYSIAILLHEAGILDRVTVYATDFNNYALKVAKSGIYDLDLLKSYEKSYVNVTGNNNFHEYYTARYNSAKIADFLKQRVTFANHNLVCDNAFGEMDIIICRNVLIYFNINLQNRVLSLFSDSLKNFGYLCLGMKESILFSDVTNDFVSICDQTKIYQKRAIQ